MTAFMFDAARKRGNAGKIGQLNPTGRYGVPEGVSTSLSSAAMRETWAPMFDIIVPRSGTAHRR